MYCILNAIKKKRLYLKNIFTITTKSQQKLNKIVPYHTISVQQNLHSGMTIRVRTYIQE